MNSSGQEKGVDVSLALDLVKATYEQRYEGAIIVSEDADFGPAVFVAKNKRQNSGAAAGLRDRFARGLGARSEVGREGVQIEQATHDVCRDPREY